MTRSKKNRRTAPSEDPSNLIDINATNYDHKNAEEKVAEAQDEVAQPIVEGREEVGEVQSEVAETTVEEGDIAESSDNETPVDQPSGQPSRMMETQGTQDSPTQSGPVQSGPATPGNRSLHQMQDGIKLNKASPTHYRLKGNVKKLGSMWEQK